MTILANENAMRRSVSHIGRNGPCPCGSGNKYKRCCLEKEAGRLRQLPSISEVNHEETNLELPSGGDPEKRLLIFIEDTIRKYPPFRKILKQVLGQTEEPDDSLARAYRHLQENFAAQIRQTRIINQELERTRKELKQLQRSQSQAAPAPVPPPAAPIQPVPDVSRYERKIAYLEEQAKASQEREYFLHRDMRRIQTENEELKRKAAETDLETDPEEQLGSNADVDATQHPRLIDFSQHFDNRLNNVPRHIARTAMAILGRLAGGDPTAFMGAIRLKACPSVMRQRIGGDWRLLFRLGNNHVHAIDLIPRQDLERRVKTLCAQYN